MLFIDNLFLVFCAFLVIDLVLVPPVLLIFLTVTSRRPPSNRRLALVYTGAVSWTLLSAAGIVTLVQS